MEVYVDDESKLTLHGLQQHYVKLKDNEKNRKLFELLDVLEFNQVCPLVGLYRSIWTQSIYVVGGDLRQIHSTLHGLVPVVGRAKLSCYRHPS